jgi:hypothetical protein
MATWTFDRFRNGILMAQGAKVKAKTFRIALMKARKCFSEYKDDVFVLRRLKPIEEVGKKLIAFHPCDHTSMRNCEYWQAVRQAAEGKERL